jgi:hypothetical protein
LDDDLAFWWTAEGIKSAPLVTINTLPLPDDMVRFFYRLQQQALLSDTGGGRVVDEFSRDRFPAGCCALRVPTKWETKDHSMVAPSTYACEMFFFTLHLNGGRSHDFEKNGSRNLIHTFLDRHGEVIELEVLEICKKSGMETITRAPWTCDPSIGLRIPAGVHYRYVGVGQFAVREEQEFTETPN